MVGEGNFRSHIGHDGCNILKTFSGFTFEDKFKQFHIWEELGDVGGYLHQKRRRGQTTGARRRRWRRYRRWGRRRKGGWQRRWRLWTPSPLPLQIPSFVLRVRNESQRKREREKGREAELPSPLLPLALDKAGAFPLRSRRSLPSSHVPRPDWKNDISAVSQFI